MYTDIALNNPQVWWNSPQALVESHAHTHMSTFTWRMWFLLAGVHVHVTCACALMNVLVCMYACVCAFTCVSSSALSAFTPVMA